MNRDKRSFIHSNLLIILSNQTTNNKSLVGNGSAGSGISLASSAIHSSETGCLMVNNNIPSVIISSSSCAKSIAL